MKISPMNAICLMAFFTAGTAFGLPGLVSAQSTASAQNATAHRVGQAAVDFELTAINGELSGDISLSDVWKDGPVVLVVLRGYPGYQCGMCTRQVNELVSSGKAFGAKNAKVLMVYPGPSTGLDQRAGEFLKGNQLPAPFTLLTDPDYAFTNAYGLRWNAPRETAYPSTFVIGQDGKLKFVNISRGHGGRTPSAIVLSAL